MKTPSSIFRLLRAAAAAGALALSAVRADADTNFAYRIDCEVQNPSGSLEPLVWEQGTTPLVEVRVLRQNRVVQVRDTTVRMIIGPSATGHYFAAVSNSVWSDINTCMIQWPSIGTNSMETGSWWYGITFHDPEGRIYWTGSGSLDIQPTLSNGEDGLIWQYFADSTERITYITTNTYYYVTTNLEEFVHSVNGQTGDVSVPSEERVGAIEENVDSLEADVADLETTLADLRGELQGPAWLSPSRFEWHADILSTVSTNIGSETDWGWAVLTRLQETVTERANILDPAIVRNQWDETLEVSADGPATLSPVGDGTYLLDWDDAAPTGSTATVSGQLGDWTDIITVQMPQPGTVRTQQLFSSFAPGGVREAVFGVYSAWTNRGGTTHRLMHHGSSTLTNWAMRTDTNNIYPNTSFWGRDLDWSGVSYVNDTSTPWRWCLTLVASNLAYGAGHWGPPVGATVAFYGRDGAVHAAKVEATRRMGSDLRLSKLNPPLDTNAVTAYPILETDPALSHVKECGTGESVSGLPPLAVAAMTQNQRAYIMQSWRLDSTMRGIWDAEKGDWIPNSRQKAIGGDSSHPVFFTTDGTNMVLYGAWWCPNIISLPGAAEAKPLILEAAASMGADPDAIAWESWEAWPTYNGPKPPGP